MKATLGVVLAALMLGGCVYEQSASREMRDERDARAAREIRESALPPSPGAPTVITPPPSRAPAMQAAAPPPDRVRSEDLARLSPGTGIAGPQADPDRYARQTPNPPRTFVQAASFVSREEAERTRRSLAGLGRTGVYTAYVDEQLRYRVRIGPLATPERTEQVREQLIRRGYAGAIIVRD